MRRPIVIGGLALGALAVAVLAMATRYDYVPVNGQLVRVDRWSGKVAAAKRPPTDDFAGIAARGKAVALPESEMAHVRIDGRFVFPERTGGYTLKAPHVELQVQNGSTYSVEWFDVAFEGDGFSTAPTKAFTNGGPGDGPRPGRADVFTADLPTDGAERVRAWKVLAAYGFPPEGQR